MPARKKKPKSPPPEEKDPRSTSEKQKAFLEAYGYVFSVSRAAELTGLNRENHYRWMLNGTYAARFKRRKEEAGNYLETLAVERAGEGWTEDVFYQGSVCGSVRRYDSGLLQFLLRGLLPQRYGAKTEISGPQGEPMQAKIEVIFVKPEN